MIKPKSKVRVVSGVLNGRYGVVLRRDWDNIFVQFDDAACWLSVDDVVEA